MNLFKIFQHPSSPKTEKKILKTELTRWKRRKNTKHSRVKGANLSVLGRRRSTPPPHRVTFFPACISRACRMENLRPRAREKSAFLLSAAWNMKNTPAVRWMRALHGDALGIYRGARSYHSLRCAGVCIQDTVIKCAMHDERENEGPFHDCVRGWVYM